jgi:hypothetical protein
LIRVSVIGALGWYEGSVMCASTISFLFLLFDTCLALRLMDVAYSDLHDINHHLITVNFALAWTESIAMKVLG